MSIKYLNDAWLMPGINAQEKILLLAIADCSNDEGYAYPGYEKLLKKTSIGSRATLSKCMKVLKGVGILNAESHGFIGNGKKVNTYTISLRCELSINTDTELIEKIKDLRKSHSNAISTGCELRKVQGVYSKSTGCVHETSLETSESKPSVLDIVNSKKFVIPTIEQVLEHIKSKNYNIDAETFIAHYNSNGWMIGKNKMKCWKSALVTWAKKSQQNTYKHKQPAQRPDKYIYTPSNSEFESIKIIEGEIIL
jgi:hypothetical protein